MAPSDEQELKSALETGLKLDGPSSVRYPRGNCLGLPPNEGAHPWEVGRGRIVFGEAGGCDVLVIAAGTILKEALAAAKAVAEKGAKVTVFDARFVKPLDSETILALAKGAGLVVTVEENALQGGFGSAVVECLVDSGMALPRILRLGLPDRFVEHASQEELKAELGLDAEGMTAAIFRARGEG
jgi:1-deoxy-D-xylulose-5-phosphate synthase